MSVMDSSPVSWMPLAQERLPVAPSLLVESVPRIAKDEDYANAVQSAWKEEVSRRGGDGGGGGGGGGRAGCSEVRPLRYDDREGTSLHGTLVRRKDIPPDAKVPGILLFHTGAGPHDVFLHWKADSLVTDDDVFPNHGCVVLIADILSDESGWAWGSDRTRYNEIRSRILTPSTKTEDATPRDDDDDDDPEADTERGEGVRVHLRARLQAALDALLSQSHVDSNRLGAMGYCLGGHSILELGRLEFPRMRAMVTFHGVFDNVPPPSAIRTTSGDHVVADGSSLHPPPHDKVLICTGAKDPFISQESISNAVATFKANGYGVDVVRYPSASHGFTNPAQDFNPNPAFAFDATAAAAAWKKALTLLKEQL